MHQDRPFVLARRESLEQPVDMPGGAGTALHRQAVRLVEHHEELVLEQRHGGDLVRRFLVVYALDGWSRRQGERRHAHAFPLRKPRRAFRALAADAHLASADYLVDVAQRQRREFPLQPFVQAQAGIGLGNLKSLHGPGHNSARIIAKPDEQADQPNSHRADDIKSCGADLAALNQRHRIQRKGRKSSVTAEHARRQEQP